MSLRTPFMAGPGRLPPPSGLGLMPLAGTPVDAVLPTRFSSLSQEDAADALAYQGTVLVLIHFAPWRLVLPIRTAHLSPVTVRAYLQKPSLAKLSGEAAAAELLAVGDPYELQFAQNPDHEAINFPTVRVRLAEKHASAQGLELVFVAEDDEFGLAGLVQDLTSELS